MKFSLGSVRQWHWISAAICIVGMLFFSWTGITLNHAADIPAKNEIATIETQLPDALIQTWQPVENEKNALEKNIIEHLDKQFSLTIPSNMQGEFSDGEFYLAMPEPGVDAWLSIDAESGELIYERTDRGWISFFNDLHKGRYTNTAWIWFIDAFAVGSIIFCLSGLWLLIKQTSFRLSTWPYVTLGVLIPFIIILTNLH
jgi:hypothetical protein